VRFPGTAGAKIEPAFPGFFSVVKEGQVIFVNADLSLMINGDVVDLASGQSLTNRIRQANRPVVNIQKLDTKDAIAIGTGARKLYVFSDPDCPYCQSLEKELEKLKDVTVYVFLFPLTSLHPQAATIAESVWCSKNKAAAWRAYLLNKELPPSATCDNPIERNARLGESLRIQGTPALIFEDGTVIPGAIPLERIEAQLAAAVGKGQVR
jgi:thiol:disulfide interchange protein DsbC